MHVFFCYSGYCASTPSLQLFPRSSHYPGVVSSVSGPHIHLLCLCFSSLCWVSTSSLSSDHDSPHSCCRSSPLLGKFYLQYAITEISSHLPHKQFFYLIEVALSHLSFLVSIFKVLLNFANKRKTIFKFFCCAFSNFVVLLKKILTLLCNAFLLLYSFLYRPFAFFYMFVI